MTRLSVLAAGAVLVVTSTTASCGFDYATDRDYTSGVGVDDRLGDVDVLAAVVVSKRPGSGTFVAGLSNGSDAEIGADSLTGARDESLTVGVFDPIPIAAGGFVNLATDDGIELTGDFTAGDFLTLSVGFDNGERSTIDVPVVTACDEYAGLDASEPSPVATFTTAPSPTIGTTSGPSAAPTTSGSATVAPSPSASVTTLAPIIPEFSCDEVESDAESSDASTAEAGG